MKKTLIFIAFILINCACSNNLNIKGDIENKTGNKVCLYILSPETQQKELISEDILSEGKFTVKISKEILPSRIWLTIENILDTTFLVDGFHKTFLKKSIKDSCYIFHGSALQAEYTAFKNILKMQYDDVIYDINEEQLKYTQQQDTQSSNACKIRKERMERLKNEYITDAICKNPNHNLSIFILQEEKIKEKEDLFTIIKPSNPNCNVYKQLSNKF